SYSNLKTINIVSVPFTMMTNGVAQAIHKDGRVLTLAFACADKERAFKAIDFAIEKIEKANGTYKESKFHLRAHTGTSLKVFDDYLLINFLPINSIFSNIANGGGRGDKRINFIDITSIQFRTPAGITAGYIQFAYPGSTEIKGGINEALNDENSVPIQYHLADKAREIVEYIEQRRSELRKGTNSPTLINQLSNADELLKFKQLLDENIITQEEFDLKKKQLLGL
ncbi:MAG: SHOCT domain-containing protein, partial [Clostridia bacterium]|nr:SHOCT domain-containing protein [Clostridia bacterium]